MWYFKKKQDFLKIAKIDIQGAKPDFHNRNFLFFIFIYHKIQLTIEQDRYTKANESGEEAQKETMGLVDIGLPQSKK